MITATLTFFFIFFILIPGILCAIIIPTSVNNYKHEQFAIANSEMLNNVRAINKNYIFFAIKNFDMKQNYDNENFYHDISCQDYLVYELVFKKNEIKENIKNVLENQKQYKKYVYDINNITKFGIFKEKTDGLNLKKLIKYEREQFQKEVLRPKTDFSIYVRLLRVDRNDHYKSSKTRSFSIEEIQKLITRVEQKRGSFYLDNEIWESICRVERGKVSNKIRFAIYKRDGYRCKMCGRSGDNNNLEIDHIIPISKGGKSTFDNLQTLCHDCNVKKGDTISITIK